MKRWMGLSVFLGTAVWAALGGSAHGDSAQVLPKGVFRTAVTSNVYFPVTERFDPDGKREAVATDFNASLNSSVFPALSRVEQGFGMPAGTASLGRSVVSFKYQFYDLVPEAQYGLTDHLTLSIKVPYYWNETKVQARLDASKATVGLNPFYGSIQDPFLGSPFVPIALGGIPLTTRQVKALLGRGLDIDGDGRIDIPGYGYKPFSSWSDSGVSDVETVARYQFYQSDHWALAFTGGARFPTGKIDDPDNLVDTGFGNGAYALLARLHCDYTGIQNLFLNGTFRYDIQLPTSMTKRIPPEVNRPLSTEKEKIDIDQGDRFEFEGTAGYDFLGGLLNLSVQYRYGFKLEDEVSGKKSNYSSLEDETGASFHAVRPGITLSTINRYRAKEFPVPFTASIEYENIFAGSNNFLQQQFLSFKVAVFF